MHRGLDEDCQTNREEYASDTTDVIRPEKVLSYAASRTPTTHAQDDATVLVQFLRKGQGEGIFREEIDIEVAAMMLVNTHLMLAERAERLKMKPQDVRHMGKTTMDILLRGMFTAEGLAVLEKEVHNK